MKANSPKHKQTATKETANQTKPAAEMADKALKNYEQAIKTSLKLQEEASKWWTSVFSQTNFTQDWQKRFSDMTGMANSFAPLAQKRMDDVMVLMEKNSRTGAELMKKAVDAAQTPVLAESQAKWMDFWKSSMGAARSNAEAFSELSTKAFDSWIDLIRKNAEVSEARIAAAVC